MSTLLFWSGWPKLAFSGKKWPFPCLNRFHIGFSSSNFEIKVLCLTYMSNFVQQNWANDRVVRVLTRSPLVTNDA